MKQFFNQGSVRTSVTLRSSHAQACISLVDLSKSIKAFSQIKSGVFTLTEGILSEGTNFY